MLMLTYCISASPMKSQKIAKVIRIHPLGTTKRLHKHSSQRYFSLNHSVRRTDQHRIHRDEAQPFSPLPLRIINRVFKIGSCQSKRIRRREEMFRPLLTTASVLSTSRWWRMNATLFPTKRANLSPSIFHQHLGSSPGSETGPLD